MTPNPKNESICCFCANDEDLFSMLEPYDYEGKSEIAVATIAECFGIEFKCDIEDNKYLYVMCKNCMKRLKDAIQFRHHIEITNDHMQALIQETNENDTIVFEAVDENDIEDNILNDDTENITIKYEIDNLIPTLNVKDGEMTVKKKANFEIEHLNPQNVHIIESESTVKKEINFEIEMIPRKTTFYCYHCNREYLKKGEFNKHMRIHGSRDFICEICKKAFLRQNDLRKHIERHEKAKLKQLNRKKHNYICDVCGKDFALKKYVIKHIKTQHLKLTRSQCTICDKWFTRKETRDDHMKIHTRKEKYRCNVCNKLFSTKVTLRNHAIQHVARLKCSMCDLKFSSYKLFKMHEKEHKKGLKFLCDICGKSFSTKRVVERHIRTQHWKIGRILCTICNKSFASQKYLRLHLPVHRNYKSFFCDVCGKGFLRKKNLASHLAKHEAGHSMCSICCKLFSSKATLKSHKKSHVLKKFQCDICAKSFHSTTLIRTHMIRVHLKIGSLICKICNRSFSTKSSLFEHEKRHMNGKIFSCNVCSRNFKNENNAKIHYLRIHL